MKSDRCLCPACSPCAAVLAVRTRAVLEYHRMPWTEPAAPNWLKIIYIDDHLVRPGTQLAQNRQTMSSRLRGGP